MILNFTKFHSTIPVVHSTPFRASNHSLWGSYTSWSKMEPEWNEQGTRQLEKSFSKNCAPFTTVTQYVLELVFLYL